MSNSGSLVAASGNLTVNVSNGGFANLSGSTLTGGTYAAGFHGNTSPNILDLNIGGTITVDDAVIRLSGGGQIATFDMGTGMFVPIQSTLNTIAQNGTLSLSDQTYNWGNLTDNGGLLLSNSAVLNASQLTVGSTGTLSGSGTVGTQLVNNGLIEAGLLGSIGPGGPADPNYLKITGNITGTGTIEIAPAAFSFESSPVGATLELGGATAQNVKLLDGTGTLVLDGPTSFSGAIAPQFGGNVVLPGVTIGSVTEYDYSGNSSGGTLTIHEDGSTIALAFSGNFKTGNFHLSAGPQLLSSSPPSLLITIGGPSLNVAPTAAYNAGAAPTALSPSATVGDISTTILKSATVAITGGTFANDGDQLTASTGGTSIAVQYDPTTETLTLTGSDTLAHYQSVLDTVSFSSLSNNPTNNQANRTRTIQWTVTDESNFTATATTTLDIAAPNPPPPAGTTANMIMQNDATGDLVIYDLGNSAILAGYPLGQLGLEWQSLGMGNFNGADTSDLLVRDVNDGNLKFFNVSNNQMTYGGAAGPIGLEWQVLGLGGFSGNPGETDLIMRNTSNNGALNYFDIHNNQIVAAGSMGSIGLEWQVFGVGDFSGNPGETDLILRNTSNGALSYFDIQHNQIVSAGSMGSIGLEWQVLGVGDFSGNPGEADLILRDINNGAVNYLDIQNNHIVAGGSMGNIGMEWQVLGFGDLSGNAGEADMLMRDKDNGALQYYGIQHNQITSSGALGNIGGEWQALGLANLPG